MKKLTFRVVPTAALLVVYTGEKSAALNADGTWDRKVLISCAKRNGYTAESILEAEKWARGAIS